MSKIKTITVNNLKAVSKLTADFNGCTAIITGGNNKGKTSFLRGLFDRIRGIKPEVALKNGEQQGFAECELTTGEKLKWEFNDKGKEKLTYITEKDIRTPLTVVLRDKYFPGTFDVDKFLTDPPAKQKKTLQQLVGIDFTDIDSRYKIAYDDREAKNRRANEEKIILSGMTMPESVEVVDLSELNKEKDAVRQDLNKKYLENKTANEVARKLWQSQCEDIRSSVQEFNRLQNERLEKHNTGAAALTQLKIIGYTGLEVETYLKKLADAIESHKEYKAPSEAAYVTELPDNSPLLAIEEKINAANETNRKAGEWQAWNKQKEKSDQYNIEANEADIAVKAIETERMNLIKSAKMPEGFSFADEGITYNGLAFTREQLSSSGIYVAALKLAAMNLGEVKALHFDASFLDKNSLAEIEAWAVSEDLQLLIERPDFEGGEIEYQLICQP